MSFLTASLYFTSSLSFSVILSSSDFHFNTYNVVVHFSTCRWWYSMEYVFNLRSNV